MSEEVEGTPSPKETGSGISADDVVPSSWPIPSARLTLSTNVADIARGEISLAAGAEMGSQRGSNSKQIKGGDLVSRKLVDTLVEDTDTGLTDDGNRERPNPVLAETEGTAPDFAATGMTASEANYESQMQPPQSVNSTVQAQQTIKEEPSQDRSAAVATVKHQVELKSQTQDEILVMATAKESDYANVQTAPVLVDSQPENGKQVAGPQNVDAMYQEIRPARRKRTRRGTVEQSDKTLMPSSKLMELRNAQLDLSRKGARSPSGVTGWAGGQRGRRRTKKVRMEDEKNVVEGRVFNGISFGVTLNKDSLARKASKSYLHDEVVRLGGVILENVADFVEAIEDGGVAVVLIAESPSRTEKFLHALAAQLPILSIAWVAACSEQGSMVSTKR
uniref:BRCT domain-containing protein n=1 Tax=Rhodosorus marinus TaxID=101924 RepID=A0A7S2ZRQ3_9RHOD|mmetsp:Transcript_30315/g.116249  ORF Transcript_30315/g.116249 Transcript_30315/m.116249 type:complete len:391 (+) Transcript_30315:221-1393(+)